MVFLIPKENNETIKELTDEELKKYILWGHHPSKINRINDLIDLSTGERISEKIYEEIQSN
jgi:hypothetical protein